MCDGPVVHATKKAAIEDLLNAVIAGTCRITVERMAVFSCLPLAGWKYGAAVHGDLNAAFEIVWTLFPGAHVSMQGPMRDDSFIAIIDVPGDDLKGARAGTMAQAVLAAALKRKLREME